MRRVVLRRFEQVESVRCCRIPAFLSALVFLSIVPSPAQAVTTLVPLVSPGPWSGVAGLIGYGGRVWFVNSEKFIDHNSADIYSYDPASGVTRFERHLFSQDAGQPTVANGLLYWPFEDARFSTGHGEYMVTNGSEWQWRILPQAEVFHVHALVAHGGALFAATGAWRGGLQLSRDGGITWQVVYDHPTPSGSVSRITSLANLDGALYAGLTDYRPAGGKLLQWTGHTLKPVDGWPQRMVNAMAEAVHYYKSNKDPVVKIMQKYSRGPSRTFFEEVFESNKDLLVEDTYPTLEGLKATLEIQASIDPKAAKAKAEDFVDLRFVNELKKSGFI